MNDVLKQEDEIFCPECGKPIKKNAVICINCGVQVKPLNEKVENKANENKGYPKMKSSAIILVILFGFFGWLYIYKRSAIKFYISLAIIIIASYFLGYFSSILYGGIWIWALIDVSIKSSSFYKNYPNE